MIVPSIHNYTIERAFSKQSIHYDEDDRSNLILQAWRMKVYKHVEKFLQPGSSILELNAGTGIDAAYFARKGHFVHATDQSEGMIKQIEAKIASEKFEGRLTCEQHSYESPDIGGGNQYDFIFSNFGGLNCAESLQSITNNFVNLLKPGGRVTMVIMPPVCPWEWGLLLKGQPKKAFRRFKRKGVMSNLEGERFFTFYYSRKRIDNAMGDRFELIANESLGLFSPPPHRKDLPQKHFWIYNFLTKIDNSLTGVFPFNRWGDHLIHTYQLSK